MPIGPGGLDSNGIWQFGEDDSEALASDLLNLGMGSVSTAISTLGGVLQVVSTTKMDTYTESVTGSAISTNVVTGLTAVITPVATSSKILVQATLHGTNSQNNSFMGFVFRRGSTAIGVANTAGDRASLSAYAQAAGNGSEGIIQISQSFMDSPESTSALTYGISLYNRSGLSATLYVNRSPQDNDSDARQRTTSTITLMEVAG